jgi:hypothetical protein
MGKCAKWFALAALAALVLGSFGPARAEFVVAPNAYENKPGGDNNGFPFNITPLNVSTMRYQQIYNANQFTALSGPELVTQIAFRVSNDIFGNAFSSTLPSIQINLSTSSKTPLTLSGTFANNVGADDKVVFNGALSLSSKGDPNVFDVVIDLTTPFLYDPSKGSLLMDVHNFKGGFTTGFDSVVVGDGSSSRAWTNEPDGVNDMGPDHVIVDSRILVTRFTFGPASVVPEPASLTLAAMGAVSLMGLARRRRRDAR